MAHVTSLAAARQAVYEPHRLRPPRAGLAGAPPLRVVVGEKRHVTLDPRAAAARDRARPGARRPGRRPGTDARRAARRRARRRRGADDRLRAGRRGEHRRVRRPRDDRRDLRTTHGAWVHVDGAFGLWAAASPALAHLVAGHAGADSWATDAPQVAQRPVRLRDRDLRPPGDARGGDGVRGRRTCRRTARPSATRWATAPSSRAGRARCPPGRRSARSDATGIAELIERSCASAARSPRASRALPGCEILNDVVLNQVLLASRTTSARRRSSRRCSRRARHG